MPRTEAGDILLFVFLLQFSNQPNLTKRQKKKVYLFISHLIFFFMFLGRLKGANLYV